jgi:hypothetical protein
LSAGSAGSEKGKSEQEEGKREAGEAIVNYEFFNYE